MPCGGACLAIPLGASEGGAAAEELDGGQSAWTGCAELAGTSSAFELGKADSASGVSGSAATSGMAASGGSGKGLDGLSKGLPG